jgi:hypothetical protein
MEDMVCAGNGRPKERDHPSTDIFVRYSIEQRDYRRVGQNSLGHLRVLPDSSNMCPHLREKRVLQVIERSKHF